MNKTLYKFTNNGVAVIVYGNNGIDNVKLALFSNQNIIVLSIELN